MNPEHLIVRAGAGTGKTTTVCNGVAVMKGYKALVSPTPEQQAVWTEMAKENMPGSVHLTSFSTSAAEQLMSKTKVACPAKDVTCSSTYGIGLRQSYRAGYAEQNKGRLFFTKYSDILCDIWSKTKRQWDEYEYSVLDLVDKARLELMTVPEEIDIDKLAKWYSIDISDAPLGETTDVVAEALLRGRRARHQFDYVDMVWMPNVDGYLKRTYDCLVVDEYQDMGIAQQELCMKVAWRVMVIGDHHQAIYGFAGADANAYKRMDGWLSKTQRGLITLPLTQTRRCCRAVVREANKCLPPEDRLVCLPDAPEGEVVETRTGRLNIGDASLWDAGVNEKGHRKSMVICPTNAPLVSLIYKLQKKGYKAFVQSKDLQTDILKLIPEGSQTVDKLVSSLESRVDRLSSKPGRAARAKIDTFRTLQEIAEGCSTLSAVRSTVKLMFPEKEPIGWLRMSSVHQAKGQEAEQVIFWEWDRCASPYSVVDWQKQQDANLLHVGVSRAMTKLIKARSEEER